MRGTHAAGVAAVLALAAPAAARAAGPPAPVDPQNWSFQDNLTWNDYKPLPGTDYSDPTIQPTVKKWKVALVVTDFPDKPFYDHAAGRQHDLRHADGRGARHPARPRAGVLPRLPQQAAGAEPLPDDEPVLDGGLLRQVRRPARLVRPLPLPGHSYQYFMTDSGGSANLAHCPDADAGQAVQR